MDVRRVLFWLAVIGLVLWIAHDPAGSAHEASSLANKIIGVFESLFSALGTFIGSVA